MTSNTFRYSKRLAVLLLFACALSLATVALFAFNPDEVIKVRADYLEFQQETQTIIGRGNVFIPQGKNWVKGDNVVYQIEEKKIVVHGRGSFFNGEQIVCGEEIVYSGLSGKGSAHNVFTERDPWVFRTEKIEQIKPKTFYASPKTSITTCDQKPLPHYRLEAEEVLVYQDERVVARKVTIYFGNVPVLTLPSFTYALKHRNYFVNVGYDEKYGVWARSGYNYDLTKNHYGALYLDWWERRGLGKGIKHYFKTGESGQGSLYYYCIKEKEVFYDNELDAYFNEHFPETTERAKFAGRYQTKLYSPLNELRVNLDLATDQSIEYELTEESVSLIPNRTSSVMLERTTSRYNLEIYLEKIDSYHELDRKYYLYSTELPKLSFATNRLSLFQIGQSRFYHQYQFHFLNQRLFRERKSNYRSEKKDYYEQRADVSAALSSSARVSRRNTLSGSVTLREEWRDHRSIRDTDDIYIARILTDIRLRSRLGQFFTNDLSHLTTRRYTETADTIYERYQGFERNRLAEKLTFKEPWWRTRLTSALNYDLRRKDAAAGVYWPEKLSDLVTELETYPFKRMAIDSRLIYDPYGGKNDFYHRKALRGQTMILKEFELDAKLRLNAYASFEYKQRRHFLLRYYSDWPAQELALNTNYANLKANLTYPLTRKWQLNSQFEYRNPHIRKRYLLEDFRLFEEEFTLTRDLHCWEIRFFYATRPDEFSPRRTREIGFEFNLKAFPAQSSVSTEFPPKLFLFQ